ncbi:hypothetical protein ABTX62_22920 [Streptomyces sp. NPDC096046]|uniref:hypothetical protein n=1 Tax=Streptomyces sp. NPDC096046 TaxID=3155542 RepID=UPI00332B0578
MKEGSSNPWLVTAQQIDARIEELRPEADRHVVGQHVISKVLLKRFATPFGSHGLKLVPFSSCCLSGLEDGVFAGRA